MSPTTNASITLGGQTYELKYGASAEFIAGNLGVNVSTMLRAFAEKTPQGFSDLLKLFSGLVAHHFLRLRQPVPTPEQWAMVIEDAGDRDAQLALVEQISAAVVAAVFPKIKAPAVKLREPAPVQELPPLTN